MGGVGLCSSTEEEVNVFRHLNKHILGFSGRGKRRRRKNNLGGVGLCSCKEEEVNAAAVTCTGKASLLKVGMTQSRISIHDFMHILKIQSGGRWAL